jgi:hypothetical protein
MSWVRIPPAAPKSIFHSPHPPTKLEAPLLKRILLWLLIAATVIAFVLHRSRQGRNLNVEPHAREVIEKAKRR